MKTEPNELNDSKSILQSVTRDACNMWRILISKKAESMDKSLALYERKNANESAFYAMARLCSLIDVIFYITHTEHYSRMQKAVDDYYFLEARWNDEIY